MKAIILAAGQGTRLRPVTLTMPKPLVPVANKPLIAYSIDILRNAGLTDIGIVVNDLSSPITVQLGNGESLGVNIHYIVQEEQLGLAHAVSISRDFLGDEPFCMFLGDNIFQDQMEAFIRGFSDSDADAAIALGEVTEPERFGIAVVEGNKIVRVIEKPKNPPSNLAVFGVYLFRPSVFEAISKIKPSARGELEITDAIQQLIDDGKTVQHYEIDGWWVDAGKPNAIINANQLVLGDLPYSIAPEGDHVIDSEVTHRVVLGKNTKVINSVIRGPVVIGANVTIKDSYIGPYTSIGDNVLVENSEVDASIIMKNCVLRDIDGRIDSSLLADNTEVTSKRNRVPAVHRFILAENSFVQL